MRYQSKRTYEWSKNIAYTVGLIASDGCLLSDGRHLDFTSKDAEQVENFVKAIGRKLTISSKNNNLPYSGFRVQFSDVAYYDFLSQIGLTPTKSKTMGSLKIPDKLYSDFIRGVFDGDGTVYGYHDPRWPTSFLYYVGFTSASPAFLHYLRDTNARLYGLKGTSIRSGTRADTLTYGKKDSKLLYDAMYQDKNSLSLSRKKHKLEGFINIDKNAKITPTRASGGMVVTSV